jgi:hypothetical protein
MPFCPVLSQLQLLIEKLKCVVLALAIDFVDLFLQANFPFKFLVHLDLKSLHEILLGFRLLA